MAGTGTKLWATGDTVTATQFQTYLQDQVVSVFDDSSARDAAFGGAGEPTLAEGMLCYLEDTNEFQIYSGSAWVSLLDLDTWSVSSGAYTIKGDVTVGENDTGHDVKFYGATDGKYMLWDESDDEFIISGQVGIGVTDPSQPLVVRPDSNDAVAINVIANTDGSDTGAVQIGLSSYNNTSDTYVGAAIGAIEYDDADRRSHLAFFTRGANTDSASTERLRITSGGNVGIGTTTPEHPLEVSSSANDDEAIRITNANESATGEVFLGFAPRADSADSTNPQAAISALEYDSADHRAHLVFYTNGSNTDSAPTERMRISSGGKTLLGKFYTFDTVSSMPLQVHYGIATRSETSGSSSQVNFYNPNGRVGYISTSGTTTTFSTSSDYRLKENVVEMSGAVDRVNALRPVRFNWIADSDNTIFDGFLAHEVSSVVPEAITGEKDAMRTVAATEAVEASFDGDGNEISPAVDAQPEREEIDAQGIDQSKLVPLLVGAIQELTARLETLESA